MLIYQHVIQNCLAFLETPKNVFMDWSSLYVSFFINHPETFRKVTGWFIFPNWSWIWKEYITTSFSLCMEWFLGIFTLNIQFASMSDKKFLTLVTKAELKKFGREQPSSQRSPLTLTLILSSWNKSIIPFL